MIVIYYDFECILPKVVDSNEIKDGESYTQAYTTHSPHTCSYTIYVVSRDGAPSKFKPRVYCGTSTADVMEHFMEDLWTMRNIIFKERERLMETYKNHNLSAEEEVEFQSSTVCHLCDNKQGPLQSGALKVRDHCHLTGRFRGAAHSQCNLKEGEKNTKHYSIPVIAHNSRGYDSHFVLREVGKTVENIKGIAQNREKLIMFEYSNLKFIDSMSFCGASINTLVTNYLLDGGKAKHKFKHTAQWCSKPEHLHLMLQGIYPYEYVDSFARLDETELPPQTEFYSKLRESNVTDEEYALAHKVWDAFDSKTLRDYCNLYCQTDVILLADVFENYRELELEHFQLDPVNYVSFPSQSFDCALKKTGIELELLTDYDG